MFVSQSRFRKHPRLHFFNDKKLHMSCSLNRKATGPILDCSVSSKGSFAYKIIFDMTEGNSFVTSMQCVQVTPAQKELLKLLNHPNAGDFASSLRIIHGLGSYAVDEDMVSPESSYHTHLLLDAINAIATENMINKLKN